MFLRTHNRYPENLSRCCWSSFHDMLPWKKKEKRKSRLDDGRKEKGHLYIVIMSLVTSGIYTNEYINIFILYILIYIYICMHVCMNEWAYVGGVYLYLSRERFFLLNKNVSRSNDKFLYIFSLKGEMFFFDLVSRV